MTVKPHVAIASLFYRLSQYGRKSWLWLILAVLGSFAIWDNWPLAVYGNLGNLYQPISIDIFPYGVLAGILLVFLIVKGDIPQRKRLGYLAIASYFLVPYVSPPSVTIYLLIFFTHTPTRSNKLIVYLLLWALAVTGYLTL